MKATRNTKRFPQSAVEYGYVGNVGCIRFPQLVRKASGIKRGDRLSVKLLGSRSVVLERLDLPPGAPAEAVSVDGCTCAQAPLGCGGGVPSVVSVGWSYVKLGDDLANEMGFLPDTAIKLVGEPSRITVTLHSNSKDLAGVVRLPCPP
jgi:hypothetical protein